MGGIELAYHTPNIVSSFVSTETFFCVQDQILVGIKEVDQKMDCSARGTHTKLRLARHKSIKSNQSRLDACGGKRRDAGRMGVGGGRVSRWRHESHTSILPLRRFLRSRLNLGTNQRGQSEDGLLNARHI